MWFSTLEEKGGDQRAILSDVVSIRKYKKRLLKRRIENVLMLLYYVMEHGFGVLVLHLINSYIYNTATL